ncbi:MAG: hypothetical protein ACI9DC_005553, partial [Gammaproteobacteria bacterium]
PLSVGVLATGVTLTPAATMNCRTATALTRWVTDVVGPAAVEILGDTPKALKIGSHYQCRPRNRQRGAKLSEHAYANAIDVMSIRFHRREMLDIARQSADSPGARFQSVIRAASCKIFRTVLGPGKSKFHDDHFHFDMRQRKNDYRVCE